MQKKYIGPPIHFLVPGMIVDVQYILRRKFVILTEVANQNNVCTIHYNFDEFTSSLIVDDTVPSQTYMGSVTVKIKPEDEVVEIKRLKALCLMQGIVFANITFNGLADNQITASFKVEANDVDQVSNYTDFLITYLQKKLFKVVRKKVARLTTDPSNKLQPLYYLYKLNFYKSDLDLIMTREVKNQFNLQSTVDRPETVSLIFIRTSYNIKDQLDVILRQNPLVANYSFLRESNTCYCVYIDTNPSLDDDWLGRGSHG